MSQAKRAKGLLRRTRQKLQRSASTVRLRSRLRRLPEFRPGTSPHVDVLVNFPDGLRNLYQLQQWFAPLEHLSKSFSVAILCYRPETALRAAEGTDLKVVLTPSFTDLSEVRNSLTPKVILYPNQNYTNYRILGLDRSQHVFICHGESDKIYMASNWVKVFNYFFIAGQASHDRLEKYVRNYDVEQRTIRIGRPQVDIPSVPEIEKAAGRITVLYAPTWEGGRSTMRYGSVESHGLSIIESLLNDGRFQIIYRPHPRTGVHLKEVKAADNEIKKRINEANLRDPTAGHFIDSTSFGWQLDFADFMITDTSAVAYDWLTTAKPLLITRPVEPLTVMPESGYLAKTHLLDASDAPDAASIVTRMLNNPSVREEQQRWSAYYYGDYSQGSSLARFENAIAHTIEEIDEFNSKADTDDSAREATLAYDELLEETTSGTTAPIRHYAKAVGTLVANQYARFRYDSALFHSMTGASTGRKAAIVVTCMAHPRNLDNLIDWLPTLEQINRTSSVAILTGNLRTYRKLRELTGLRLLVAFSAVRTEWIMQELSPSLILHFEQSKLNLREATYRSAAHAYVGDADNNSWINNRIRLFDAVITNSEHQSTLAKTTLVNFPSTVDVLETSISTRVATLNRLKFK